MNEIYDIKGILKAIETRNEITKALNKAQDIADQQQINLEKILTRRKSLINLLGGKTIEEKKTRAQNALIETMHELEMIKITEKIISCRLGKIEIPYFRKTKSFHFTSILRAFRNATVEEFTSLIDQSKRVQYIHTSK